MTPQGERRVEDLRVGDLVATRDHGLQKLRWIGNRRIMARELSARPELRAIRISAGSLGRGLPKSDLLVSPQHRILVRSLIAQRMFGTPEVLVAAKQLLELDGIDRAEDLDEIEYFHLLFDRHEIVYSNGAETESLYTGAEALRGVGMAARDEIFALFPELRRDGWQPASARPLVPGSQGRTLAARHLRNGKSLQH
ncbi:Hint domain-containing protein [Paracoccus caeni]|uniref:Hint domain-containing protein n=2 Tax=Paracoccus caeni TaxID=657651 RepID=A0A934VTT3_9RHOB|nr:Hint domain-containing protein [Paracoccus caeni]